MTEPFAAVEIISAKRDNVELSDPQIDWIVDAYTRGVVADEQMSSLLMAILLNGMNMREISRWTDAMINSGERMNWSALSRKTADKHSTGGVGDKITLPLAPLVAACGGGGLFGRPQAAATGAAQAPPEYGGTIRRPQISVYWPPNPRYLGRVNLGWANRPKGHGPSGSPPIFLLNPN